MEAPQGLLGLNAGKHAEEKIMERAIVVRGKLSRQRHIELDEPVSEMEGPVEVVLRPARIIESETKNGSLLDLLAHLPAGTRTKVDIDQQIREEREDWSRS